MDYRECSECGQMFEPDDELDEYCLECWSDLNQAMDYCYYGDNDDPDLPPDDFEIYTFTSKR